MKEPVDVDLFFDEEARLHLRLTYGNRNQVLPFNEEIIVPDWLIVKLAALLNQHLSTPKQHEALKGLVL